MDETTNDIRLTEALILNSIYKFREKNRGIAPKKIYISPEIFLLYRRYQNLIAYEKEPETLYGIPVEVDKSLKPKGYYLVNEFNDIFK